MSTDPRAALATFIAAIERHFEAAASRRGDDDPAVVSAYQELADAFEVYDEAIDDAFGEVTPSGSTPRTRTTTTTTTRTAVTSGSTTRSTTRTTTRTTRLVGDGAAPGRRRRH
ncbi:hypothetical protein [Arsenicicoccus dermatophilus]|uniref:hypothetical protein n=1 Tax=Arsenicicoccus dermatophilus TaxID=1076331 RepID=UPI001F4D18DE|nr:hypothetical protein [Arsenicicoccus dermatophilus]MCH8612517.1 hypothetical protein [Arsenicicoccus dermatophilus]